MTALQTLAPEAILLRIAKVGGLRVIVDADLAAFYGAETKRFNEAVERNLAKRLAELEEKTEALAMNHDTFSHKTRAQLKKVFDALRELMTPPDPPKRPIGFINPEEKGSKKSTGARSKP